MATDKYDLHTIDYSVQGWNTIMSTDMEILDNEVNTRLIGTLGETVASGGAVYLNSDGKYYNALANNTKQPTMGLVVEPGVLDDSVRIQRVGEITNTGWSWGTVGDPVFLSPTTSGVLTDTEYYKNRQIVGMVLSATSVFLNVELSRAVEDKIILTADDDSEWELLVTASGVLYTSAV